MSKIKITIEFEIINPCKWDVEQLTEWIKSELTVGQTFNHYKSVQEDNPFKAQVLSATNITNITIK